MASAIRARPSTSPARASTTRASTTAPPTAAGGGAQPARGHGSSSTPEPDTPGDDDGAGSSPGTDPAPQPSDPDTGPAPAPTPDPQPSEPGSGAPSPTEPLPPDAPGPGPSRPSPGRPAPTLPEPAPQPRPQLPDRTDDPARERRSDQSSPSRTSTTPAHATLTPPRAQAARPGAPALDTLSPAAARSTPTPELLDRSRSTIDAALQAGSAAGGGPGGAGAIARVLQAALQRDENGHTVFDARELALVEERRHLEAELRRRGAAPDLISRLMSNLVEQGQVKRERDRLEGLLSLMVSLTFGNIPTALINRLVELGLGPEVERAMREAIGNGRHLSRGAIRDLMSLASSGLGSGPSMPSVGTAPEHHVEDYYREQDERTARVATATGGARMVRPDGRDPDGAPSTPSDLSSALRSRAAAQPVW